ncbi:MAG: C45 family autoproteolytic acyltransferase/hydrolase [Clostridia bacterium]|nr:C45 family autoproteolytic acyltransferase/hydrolase [Clostridia bacterium]
MNTTRTNAWKRAQLCANAIRENLRTFWVTVEENGRNRADLLRESEELFATLSENRREEIFGMAEGSGCPANELFAFNTYGPMLQPEGCTVFFAAGKSSATGATIHGKNSDKGGDLQLTDGERCVNFHEINVVSWFDNEDGSHVIGVSAAGSTGIKMGMNSHGVTASTNYGYTTLARNRKLSVKDRFAGDRAQIARDALQKKTALEAAQYAAQLLLAHPMATSGMLEFGDADSVYVVENAYEYLAIHKVTDAADSRSNYLETLGYLNEEGSASCYCRYHRSQKLIKEVEGHATVEDLKRISMDHYDGTGSNGICRHTPGLESSTQASAVMEVCREAPERSVIHIALGKPCSAWRNDDGHISIPMDMKPEEIPEEFLRGDAYVKYGFAEPVLGEGDRVNTKGDIA